MVHRENVSHVKCRDTNQQGVLIATTKMLVVSAKSWCHDNSTRHSLYFIFCLHSCLVGSISTVMQATWLLLPPLSSQSDLQQYSQVWCERSTFNGLLYVHSTASYEHSSIHSGQPVNRTSTLKKNHFVSIKSIVKNASAGVQWQNILDITLSVVRQNLCINGGKTLLCRKLNSNCSTKIRKIIKTGKSPQS